MAWNPIPGIVENLAAEGIVAALIGGGVLAWLKKRSSPWLVPICWGLGGAVAILVGVGALRVIAIPLPDQSRRVTPNNVESLAVTWLDNFHLNVQNQPMEGMLFHRIINMNNNNRINVSRLRELDRYIMLNSVIVPGPQQPLFGRLSAQQTAELIAQIRAEAARSKTNTSVEGAPFQIELEKRIPITDALTEDIFISDIDDMDSVIVLLQETIQMALRRNGILQ